MCARYKAETPDAPSPAARGRVSVYGQAAPRRRVLPTRPQEDYSDEDREPCVPEPPYRSPEECSVAPPREGYRMPPGNDEPEDFYSAADYAFGTPGPRRELPRRHSAPPRQEEKSPWEDFRRPPKKGMSPWKALWLILSFPFRIIGFITRHLPKLILWPIRIFVSCTFVGFILLGILAVIYGLKAKRYDLTQIMRMPERTIVLDRKGNEIGTLHGENRRRIADIDAEVPKYFIDALIMQEDRSFWTHGGVDARGVGRAVQQVFRHGRATQGASTLTMQLAKNTYNHRKRNLDAKLTEVALARRIESTYDKKTILTCYINRVFWGHTFLGLKQAASGYFNKQPRDLTIGEAAMLAGIICGPNEFSPYKNPAKAKEQRDKVLALLYNNGHITRVQYETALAESIVTDKPVRRGIDNYALDLIRSEVDHILAMLDRQQQRIREEAVYAGGLVVRTTLDVDLQDDVMKELDHRLVEMLEKQKGYRHETRAQYRAEVQGLSAEEAAGRLPRYVQAACVMVDNATGALLTVVGGRDSTESPLNRAVQSRRQVGSIFKPIVYSTFFERGGSPESMVSDDRLIPGEIPGAKRWNPGNSDGRFTGMHPAGWGLLKSRNTMSVRVGHRAGLTNVVNTALLAGFPRSTCPKGPTIYLGTWEASPLEVAGAYTVFANGGVRPTPYIIESITDAAGHLLWRNPGVARRIFSQRTARLTSSILQQITKPGGTAGRMQQLGFTAPSGGKTGTTNGYKNAWFCGFTSDITAVVWVGFDRPVTIADKAYGGTLAMPLWVGVMQKAQQRGYPMTEIRISPAGSRRIGVRLCRTTGGLAHSGCEYQGTAYTETMADFTKPRALCTAHDELAEDPDAQPGAFRDDDVAEEPDDDTTPDIDDVVAEEA